jgi:cytochrome c oxidase assembly protein subunit 15
MDLRQLAATGVNRPAGMNRMMIGILGILALQLCYGAFVAGMDAGFIFAEWPMMGGQFFPANVPLLAPFWHNLFDQPVVVQFLHRWFAWIVAGAMVLLALRLNRYGQRPLAFAIIALVVIQIALGIATLLSGVAIDIAVAHQAVGALILVACVIAAHRLGRPTVPVGVTIH